MEEGRYERRVGVNIPLQMVREKDEPARHREPHYWPSFIYSIKPLCRSRSHTHTWETVLKGCEKSGVECKMKAKEKRVTKTLKSSAETRARRGERLFQFMDGSRVQRVRRRVSASSLWTHSILPKPLYAKSKTHWYTYAVCYCAEMPLKPNAWKSTSG